MLHVLLTAMAITLLLANTANAIDNTLLAAVSASEVGSMHNGQQRALYERTKQAFEDKSALYPKLKRQLADYPLYPYLVYSEISFALDVYNAKHYSSKQQPSKERKILVQKIDKFLSAHNQSYLGDRLLTKWLNYLSSVKNWRDYKHYYQPQVKKTDLHCFYLRAKINTGEAFPAKTIESLWLTEESLPKACDSLLSQWEKQGHLTAELLWTRYELVLKAGNYSLANYLYKKMDTGNQYLAKLYREVDKKPETIKNIKQFSALKNTLSDSTPNKVKNIILHGLHRYARSEPLETLNLLNRLQNSHLLDTSAIVDLHNRISTQLIKKDEIQASIRVINKMPLEETGEQIEHLLRLFLANQQWMEINHWIEQLPPKQYLSDRWQYWKARALEERHKSSVAKITTQDYTDIYKKLANSRSFYGFLAADKLKLQYQLEDKPAPINIAQLEKVGLSPSFQRAKEFFLLNEMHLARTEWSYGIRNFSAEDYIAAAQLAHLWGWNRKAIEAMAGAAYWDDLSIRFPIVHEDIIKHKAQTNNIPSSLIFSIARQESAWEFDATSYVGASGLMQIMPATAKETAKKAKLHYAKSKLYEPEYNIALGSHYITSLLQQYDNNRALAIASYNAGPHRVKQWLTKTNASLPLDVWIEIIPFNETRKYVQNVLSYEVIYNYRLGQESRLLTLAEANSSL
jgi:soluble lytic murein transglycosylase